ncbi:hypothetical protein QTP88_025997 [Uroleucon formosanum]
MLSIAEFLDGMPSFDERNFSRFHSDNGRSKRVPVYITTDDQPCDQIIVTDKSNLLLRYLHNQWDKKHGGKKRELVETGEESGSSSRKRPRNDLTENINVEAYVPDQVDNTIFQLNPQNDIDENASEICPTYEHQPITDQTSIIDQVRNWAVKFNVTHNYANSMLNILRSQQIDIPKDIRTILGIPKTHLQTPIQNGSYIHLGFDDMVFPIIIRHFKFIKDLKILKISLNIDGLPLSVSSMCGLFYYQL